MIPSKVRHCSLISWKVNLLLGHHLNYNSVMILKKLFQAIVILLITFIVLELGFQFTHFLFFSPKPNRSWQEHDQNELRIMCIGESITSGIPLDSPDSYPRILEQLLKNKYPSQKIKVINRGLIGAPTSDIVKALPDWLKNDKPHIVISMLGIGDRFFTHETLSFKPPAWLTPLLLKSRVLRFINLAYNYATFKVQPNSAPAWELTLDEGNYYREIFKKGVSFKTQKKWNEAINSFEFFIDEVQKLRAAKIKKGKANENIYALQIPQSLLDFYYGAFREIMGIHIETNTIEKTARYLIKALELDPKSAYLHFMLARVYRNQKNINLALEHETIAEKLLNNFSSKKTQDNYKQVASLIQNEGAIHIVMQYPMRSLNPLKLSLQDFPQIVYVDNETPFKQLAQGEHYFEYFNDICGGNFGHGTLKGNSIIAQNILNQFFSLKIAN